MREVIERMFLQQRFNEHMVKKYLFEKFKRALIGEIKIYRTPIGDRIVIACARPQVIIGRKGATLRKIANDLKEKFNLENPQIDVKEVENPNLEPLIVATRIANRLARWGPKRFRKIAAMALDEVMSAGARGVEISMAGKLPGERGKKWKFKKGYIPKCGEAAIFGVKEAFVDITLPPGNYGIRVKILPPDVRMPDEIIIKEVPLEELGEKVEKVEEKDEGNRES